MGLFSKFKNNYSKKEQESNQQFNNNTNNNNNNQYTNQNQESEEETSSNPLHKYRRNKEQKNKENLIINSLKPYSCTQKLILWNDGEKETIYGYPEALIPSETGYIILYRKRAIDFFEELIIKLRNIFLGSKEQYRILKVPEYCIQKGNEVLTVYAHSFRVINPLTEEVIPIECNDPRQRIFWDIERQKAEAYRNAMTKILEDELPVILERAIALNPTMKAYQGREGMKGRKESRAKEFSGMEMGFSVFDELENQLKKGAGIDE
ncbi:hypothetical protein [Methanococcus voltae]|uniref:Uncharacterized protein n=1 Tax=Methanococcus voltae (strain ATCC BAA-1334 / A3) TaxID=456320 RepID=D7DQQ6_METV3|nr:hypothetical protein [Methanococcus voltae]MCS3900843.1 hypothetical protein [Methanococcus voltae]